MDVRYHIKETPEEQFSASVFERIAAAIREEPHLLHAGARALQESYEAGLAVAALDSGDNPVGYTRLSLLKHEALSDSWFELGSTWVHQDCRRHGVNAAMYRLLLPRHREKNILATTTNNASFAVGETIGLVPIARKELPPQIWQSSCCCPLAKTVAYLPGNADCVRAYGEPQLRRDAAPCRFRVTAETADRMRRTAQCA